MARKPQTPTSHRPKAIREMLSIGIVGLASQFAENQSMGNGSTSRELCWNRAFFAVIASFSGPEQVSASAFNAVDRAKRR
jgi:hypothetical protein